MKQRRSKKYIKFGYLALLIYVLYVIVILVNESLALLHFTITLGAFVLISILLLIVSIIERKTLLIISSAMFTLLFIFEYVIRLINHGYNITLINHTVDVIYHSLFIVAIVLFGIGILNFVVLIQKRKQIHALAFENSRAVYIEYDKGLKKYVLELSKNFMISHQIKNETSIYSFDEFLSFTHEKDKEKLKEIFLEGNIDFLNEISIKFPETNQYLLFIIHTTKINDKLLWIAFDVTDLDSMKKQLAFTESKYQELSLASKKVIENTTELIVIVDPEGNVIQASKRYCEVFECNSKMIRGSFVNNIGKKYHNDQEDWIRNVIDNKITYSVIDYDKHGEKFVISWKNILLTDFHGKPTSIISMGEDITKITNLTSSLEYQANYNQITNLLNKNGLNQRINGLKDVRTAACFMIDIDEFYAVVDYYGSDLSKKLLITIADELRALTTKEDILANDLDEKFMIMLVNPSKVLIEKMKESLEEQIVKSYIIDETYIQVKKRIGYALYKDDSDSFKELLNYAGLASYYKTDTAYNQVIRYQPSMKNNLEKNIILTNRLYHAINNKKIDIHMQHIVNALDQKIVYVEALARWHDEVIGFISPDEFFRVARKSNLLEMLEVYLVHKSLSSYKTLKINKAYQDVKLTINLTPEMFLKEGFAEKLAEITKSYGINHKDVFVEVSENIFVYNMLLCNQMIKKFKDFGFYIAIDDFGSKYSSLAVLENIEYDMIKIDGSFINHLESKKNLAIVQMISQIGSMSEKIIVAEMVETKEVSDILVKTNIYMQQGYFFHKPQKLI